MAFTTRIGLIAMGIPRLARLLIFSTLIITIPTLYLLYPHRDTIIQHTQGYLEKGGIDSSHWRDPLPPDVETYEHEEVRDWNAEKDTPGPGQMGLNVLDDPAVTVHASEGDKGPAEMTMNEDVLGGGVIMPKLENATAKYASS